MAVVHVSPATRESRSFVWLPAWLPGTRSTWLSLTAADLFAGGKVSRVDSRVHCLAVYLCPLPTARSALDATLLGAGPGDTLDDLFLGSRAVSRAWAAYTGQEPSSPAAVYASCKARADASSPAACHGSYPSSEASRERLCPVAPGVRPVTSRTMQGMARVRSGQAPGC